MAHEVVTVAWEGRPVEAFVPHPLSEVGQLGSATRLDAARAQGVLSATAVQHDPWLEVAARLLLRAEGVASSRIEAIDAPAELIAVADVDPSVGGPAAEVSDNLRAIDVALAHEGPLSCEDLWKWHRILMTSADPDDNLKGAWRDRLGWVGGPTPHRAAHVATPADRIETLMRDLVDYASNPPHDPVTAAALLHAQFETIHPFADGNGRIGRLLISWTLHRHGPTRATAQLVGRRGAPRPPRSLTNSAKDGMNKYDCFVAVERLTVSLESELAVAVREAAVADELNVSAWLADAARRQLASRGLRDVVTEWESEHGAFSDDELAAARRVISG